MGVVSGGWTCPNCHSWVEAGTIHYCTSSYPLGIQYVVIPSRDYEKLLNTLEEVSKLLRELVEIITKGDGNASK